MNEFTKRKKKCIYNLKKEDNILYYNYWNQTSWSFWRIVRLSSAAYSRSTFRLWFFVDTTASFGFSLGKSYSCHLWEPDHWPGFKLEHEVNVGLGFPKGFTDKGSNDPGSNDKGSNDTGSKVWQRVKRQKVKMIKIFFDLNHRKLAILITKICQTFLKI